MRYRNHRRRILDIAIHGPLGGVIHERGQAVELALGQRVELVVVANGTVGGQSEPDLRHGFSPIPGVVHGVFFRDDPALVGGDVAAVEPRSHPLVESRVGKQITGQLLESELVEGHIAIEGVDDPVAVGPDFAVIVEMDAIGIRIAGGVEPVMGPVFAPVRRLQQVIHEAFVSLRCAVLDEGVHVGRRRRQAGQVQAEPPGQGSPIGFRRRRQTLFLQLGENEAIDAVANPTGVLYLRKRRALRRDEGPVGLIVGAGGNPAAQRVLLAGGQGFAGPPRRHPLARVVAEDALDERTLVGMTGNNGLRLERRLALVEAQSRFA